jgi:hypothetical protein
VGALLFPDVQGEAMLRGRRSYGRRATVEDYRLRMDRMPEPGDLLPYSFAAIPGRCCRMIYSPQIQAMHCLKAPAWKGVWTDRKGGSWYLEACNDHLDHSPSFETGRVVVNVLLDQLGRRRPKAYQDNESDRIIHHSRNYSRPAAKRYSQRRSSNAASTRFRNTR